MTFKYGSQFVVVIVYVDDILVTGNSSALIAKVKAFLHTQFKIKDLIPMKYFLGLEIARSSTGIFLNQRKYALDILNDTGLSSVKPSVIPIEKNYKLLDNQSPLLNSSDMATYMRLVGHLLYLTITRPDQSYGVHVLSQFISCPREVHLAAAYKMAKYIKGTVGQGLFSAHSLSLQYSDSDGGCSGTRRSLTGHSIMLGSSLVS